VYCGPGQVCPRRPRLREEQVVLEPVIREQPVSARWERKREWLPKLEYRRRVLELHMFLRIPAARVKERAGENADPANSDTKKESM
jgi:hypothetical protein